MPKGITNKEMPDTLDTLSIEIKSNAEQAAASIQKLRDAFKGFSFTSASKSLEKFNEGLKGLNNIENLAKMSSSLAQLRDLKINASIANQITKIAEAADKLTDDQIRRVKEFSDALSGLKGIPSFSLRLPNGKSALGGASIQGGEEELGEGKMSRAWSWSKVKLPNFKTTFMDIGSAARVAANGVKTLLKPFTSLTRAMGRIALYRAMRSVIREIAQSAKEGVTNLYQWSAAVGGASYSGRKFKDIMDGVASSTLYLKNAFGTALSNAIAALAPTLDSIADKVVNLINQFNNLLAVLRGDSTYNKAVKTTEQFATATGKAAKELKNLVFGFDELNIIPALQGGGGAAATDYSGMFEEVPVDETEEWVQKWKELQSVLESIGKAFEKIKSLVGTLKMNWKSFTTNYGFSGETVAKTTIAGLMGLMGGVTGFTLGGSLGSVVGTVVGVALGLQASSVLFDSDGVFELEELKDSLLVLLGAAAGAITFGKISGNAWLGATVGAVLAISLISGEFDKTLSKLHLGPFRDSLKIILGAATGASIGWTLAGVPGALFGATAGAILTLFLKDNGEGTFQNKGIRGFEAIKKIVEILTAAFMGFILFAIPGGGIIAATIGFTLTLAVWELDWTAIKDAISNAFNGAKEWFDLQLRNFFHWLKGENTEQRIINSRTGDSRYRTIGDKKDIGTWMGNWDNIPISGSYASGGVPDMGALFLAGESGPEFVGNVGGQTMVYNEDQLAQTLAVSNEGLINTILAAANALIGAIDDKNLTVNIGDREIAASAARGSRLNGRAMVQ